MADSHNIYDEKYNERSQAKMAKKLQRRLAANLPMKMAVAAIMMTKIKTT